MRGSEFSSKKLRTFTIADERNRRERREMERVFEMQRSVLCKLARRENSMIKLNENSSTRDGYSVRVDREFAATGRDIAPASDQDTAAVEELRDLKLATSTAISVMWEKLPEWDDDNKKALAIVNSKSNSF
jgi:ribosomal protein S3AE